MEGTFLAQNIIKNIAATMYETIEGAIMAKQALVDNFENEFGFSREMEDPDSNYALNLGILDRLKAYGILYNIMEKNIDRMIAENVRMDQIESFLVDNSLTKDDVKIIKHEEE